MVAKVPRLLLSIVVLTSTLHVGVTEAAPDQAHRFGALIGSLVLVTGNAVDAAGNSYVAGWFTASNFTLGGVVLSRLGVVDAFVAKLDPNGTTIWARNFGGVNATTMARSVAVDDAGNVHVGGYFSGASLTEPALQLMGGYVAFAIKLDSTGATVWGRGFGGNLGTYAYGQSIAVDGGSNVYLGGYFHADMTTPPLVETGYTDAFVIKLDPNGEIVWSTSFGGAPTTGTHLNALVVDAAGNVYAGGSVIDGELTHPPLAKITGHDAFVIKLDSTGGVAWAQLFGGGGPAAGASIAIDSMGSIYLGGSYYGGNLTKPPLPVSGSQYNAFLIKLEVSGAVAWAKQFGGSASSTMAKALAVDGSDNVYLAGNVAGQSSPPFQQIASDAFVVKLDASGSLDWARNFGGAQGRDCRTRDRRGRKRKRAPRRIVFGWRPHLPDAGARRRVRRFRAEARFDRRRHVGERLRQPDAGRECRGRCHRP